MFVDITELQEIQQKLSAINKTPLEDIVWTKDGKEVLFSEEDLVQFSYMGLSNIHLPKYFKYEEK